MPIIKINSLECRFQGLSKTSKALAKNSPADNMLQCSETDDSERAGLISISGEREEYSFRLNLEG